MTVAPSAVPQRIAVIVARIDGDKVRLGYDADREAVVIHREAVQRRVDEEAEQQGPKYIGEDVVAIAPQAVA